MNNTKYIERYIVTCVDSGDSCDGRPDILGIFKTKEEAVAYIEQDIEHYEQEGHKIMTDSVWTADTCVWECEKVKIWLD